VEQLGQRGRVEQLEQREVEKQVVDNNLAGMLLVDCRNSVAG
jgi:hypothetical protein